jgi:glycosyltransferase involved in cell wall biosynthesis
MIEECLASLTAQRGDVDAEIVVADTTGIEALRAYEKQFGWVKVLPFKERRTIPQLRAAALAESRGEIVAVIEDHCLADEHWFEEIAKAHRDHPNCIAVGGAVENGRRKRLIDWAVFFCEYTPYMRPLPTGLVDAIPGNNASYKRRAFEGTDDLQQALTRGFWETTLHPRLRERGERFLRQPSVVVYHNKHFGAQYALSQRYHYSRYYAGMLFGGARWPKRAVRAAASLALPPLLMARIGTGVLRKRRHLKELALATPYLAVLAGSWGLGEAVGCLLGPGRSLSKIE